MANDSKVKDTDHGYRAMLARLTRASSGVKLTVGIHERKGNEEHAGANGLTIADVGAFHEFGLGTNPRRSFIADWSDEREEDHRSAIRKVANAVVSGKLRSLEQGLERLGSLFVGEVQKRMAEGILPELKEATIDRKGSSVPLIDTGVLRSSITYEITGATGGSHEGGGEP